MSRRGRIVRRARSFFAGAGDDTRCIQPVRTFPARPDPARNPGVGTADVRGGGLFGPGSRDRGIGRPVPGRLHRRGRSASEVEVSTDVPAPVAYRVAYSE